MDNLARFYQRNLGLFGQRSDTLYINPPPQVGPLLRNHQKARVFTQDFAQHRILAAASVPVEFGCFPTPDQKPREHIILRLPREKGLLAAWLSWCARALSPAGNLWLAGENRAGIKSAPRQLGNYFEQVAKRDSARHCALFQARVAIPGPPFDETEWFERWNFELGGQSFAAFSMPGVFSHGRLDPGTQLFLETLQPGKLEGEVLDFACGSGVIGMALKALNPRLRVTLLDNNALALAATQRTLAANGVEGKIFASDGLSEVTNAFDVVVSNPPFHEGVATRTQMSTSLLATVRNFLNPGGQLLVVVNRHLPYGRWLDRLCGAHELLASDRRYHVLRATANH